MDVSFSSVQLFDDCGRDRQDGSESKVAISHVECFNGCESLATFLEHAQSSLGHCFPQAFTPLVMPNKELLDGLRVRRFLTDDVQPPID